MDEMKIQYCTSCGAGNPMESKFCSSCGTKLEEQVFEEELNIHYEDETVYSSTELFNNYYASDYINNPTKNDSTSDYSTLNAFSDERYEQPATSSATVSTAINSNNSYKGGNIGFSIASMICGIFSVICCCTVFGLVTGIIAVVFGIIVIKSKYDGKGMAVAGLITGGIGIFVWIIFMVIGGFGLFLDILEY